MNPILGQSPGIIKITLPEALDNKFHSEKSLDIHNAIQCVILDKHSVIIKCLFTTHKDKFTFTNFQKIF